MIRFFDFIWRYTYEFLIKWVISKNVFLLKLLSIIIFTSIIKCEILDFIQEDRNKNWKVEVEINLNKRHKDEEYRYYDFDLIIMYSLSKAWL